MILLPFSLRYVPSIPCSTAFSLPEITRGRGRLLRGKDKDVSEVSAEVGTAGVKLNVKRQVEAAANLALALNKSQSTQSPSTEQVASQVRTQEVVNLVSKAVTAQTVQQVAAVKVLWVDDNPSNNYYERSALKALGIQFTLSTSTEDALAKVGSNKYDAIISDMSRPPDRRAGYTLLVFDS
jgi:PleD family two-component response regulator